MSKIHVSRWRFLVTVLLATAAAVAIPGCAALRGSGHAPDRPASPLDPPPLGAAIRIFDTHTGEELDLDTLLDRLARKEAVFLGETHIDESTHRLELAVYEGLIRRRPGKVVLAMEMFERDVQPVLDDYLAGRITEAQFLSSSRPWGNYRTGYRPLIETARREGLPVIASNPPAKIRRKLAFAGPEGMKSLSPEERAFLPEELFPNSEEYWKRFSHVVRGHMAAFLQSPERRLTSSQSLWDNSMGETAARVLERDPGSLVLHVNGGFHSSHREGAVGQLLRRRPGTDAAVVEASPVHTLAGVAAPSDSGRADYLVYTLGDASGLSEGFHSVTAYPDLRYRLHVPHGASDTHPVPLLIWMPDDGLRSDDGLALWREALGDEAAVAVVEKLHPEMEADLHIGGRWYWKETFREDLGTLKDAVESICGYVVRHFPVRRDAVVLAGEGTGATVSVAAALYSKALALPVIAARPRRFAGLHEMPLPEDLSQGSPPASGLAGKSLTVLPLPRDREWWEREMKDYAGVRLPGGGRVRELPAAEWESFRKTEAEVRGALGLEAAPATGEAGGGRDGGILLVHAADTALARYWARLAARKIETKGERAAVVAQSGLGAFFSKNPPGPWTVRPLAFRGEAVDLRALPEGVKVLDPYGASDLEGDGAKCLPVAPGAFGGTTVVLVPAEAGDEERRAWGSLAEGGAIHARNRFATLRIASEGRGRGDGLAAVLEDLRGGGGRSSVVIVPALFCATPETMWPWRKAAAPFEDTLDITWLPGLGGRLHLLEGE